MAGKLEMFPVLSKYRLCCKLEIKIDALNYIARSVFSYKPTALYYT